MARTWGCVSGDSVSLSQVVGSSVGSPVVHGAPFALERRANALGLRGCPLDLAEIERRFAGVVVVSRCDR